MCLSFRMGRLSLRWQLFHTSFPAVSSFLFVLSLDKACSVDDLGVMLEVIDMARQGLLSFPLREVIFSKLVLHVEPQRGLGGHIAPPEPSSVGQPRVDVMNQGAG